MSITIDLFKAGIIMFQKGIIRIKKHINFFKGTETQAFFEDMEKGNIKVSYKLQNVDLIPKKTKGKVKDLLSKVDEKNKLNEVAKELEIGNILDNDIDAIGAASDVAIEVDVFTVVPVDVVADYYIDAIGAVDVTVIADADIAVDDAVAYDVYVIDDMLLMTLLTCRCSYCCCCC